MSWLRCRRDCCAWFSGCVGGEGGGGGGGSLEEFDWRLSLVGLGEFWGRRRVLL